MRSYAQCCQSFPASSSAIVAPPHPLSDACKFKELGTSRGEGRTANSSVMHGLSGKAVSWHPKVTPSVHVRILRKNWKDSGAKPERFCQRRRTELEKPVANHSTWQKGRQRLTMGRKKELRERERRRGTGVGGGQGRHNGKFHCQGRRQTGIELTAKGGG